MEAKLTLLIAAAVGALSACGGDDPLSEPPPKVVNPYKGTASTSTAQIDLRLPLSAVTAVVEKAIPANYAADGRAHFCKHVLIGNLCGDIDYDYVVVRHAMQVSKAPGTNNAVRVTVPLSLSGKGVVNGALGRAVGGKNFQGDTTVFVDLGLSINQLGCPEVVMTTDYTWTSHPRLEIASGVWVDVDDAGNSSIQDALKKAKADVQAAVSCDKLNELVAQNWKHYSLPLQIPGQGLVNVNVTPVKLGTAGTVVDGNDLRLIVIADALTSVSTSPLPATPIPKPMVTSAVPGPSTLKIALPIYIGYDRIESAIKSYSAGKTFAFDVKGRLATVQVLDAQVYPAGDALAVGLKFNAELPGKLFDTQGWVYLVGKPTISPDGKTFQLANINFTRELDSDFWSLITTVFQNQIRAELAKATTVDVSAKLAEATTALKEAFDKNGVGPGYKVVVSQPSLALRQIVVTDSLLVEPQLDAKLDISADLLKLVKSP